MAKYRERKICFEKKIIVAFVLLVLVVELVYLKGDDLNETSEYSDTKTFNKIPGVVCNKWVVITTIFKPTKLIYQVSKLPGWCQVIVGDVKSEPFPFISDNTVFLSIQDQRRMEFEIIKHLPENHFGRKNIGYLYAISMGAEMIYDTDDDNILKFGYIKEDFKPMKLLRNKDSNVVNVYKQFGDGKIWPRGFPLDLITPPEDDTVVVNEHSDVKIIQSMADHDPDVDAIYRMTYGVPYNFRDDIVQNIALEPGVFSPFNAQATLFKKESFFTMLLPISVHGRVTDIWRSYIAQTQLWNSGYTVAFTSAFVTQCRNPHDYRIDFTAEKPLYESANELINFLSNYAYKNMVTLYTDLIEHGFLRKEDLTVVRAWINDLDRLGVVERRVPFMPRRENIPSVTHVTSQTCEDNSVFDECLKTRPLVMTSAPYLTDFTNKRVLVLGSHNGPLKQTVLSLINDYGVRADDIGTVCANNYCHHNEDLPPLPLNRKFKARGGMQNYLKSTYAHRFASFDGMLQYDVSMFDIIICPFNIWACGAYVREKKKVVILRMSHSPWHFLHESKVEEWFGILTDTINDSGSKTIITSNNFYHYTQFRHVFGGYTPIIWTTPESTRAVQDSRDVYVVGSTNHKFYGSVYDSLVKHNDTSVTFHNYALEGKRFEYEDIYNMKRALVFPYAAHTMKINELHTQGITLILPSKELMIESEKANLNLLFHRDKLPDNKYVTRTCSVDVIVPQSMAGGKSSGFTPEALSDSISYWINFVEWYEWDNVRFYNSFEPREIFRAINNNNLDD